MAVGWDLLRALPVAELSRLSDAQIAEHLQSEPHEPRHASPVK